MRMPFYPRVMGYVVASWFLFSLGAASFNPTVAYGLGAPASREASTGCDPDPQALQAISTSIAAALTQSRSGDLRHTWRVHSICRQNDWAYGYVKAYWRDTLQPLPSPSDIVLIHLTPHGWQTVLPENKDAYATQLSAVPAALLPGSMKSMLSQSTTAPLASYSGYRLPYPAGQSAYVVRHWYPAIDFTVEGGDVARNAKGGTVVFVKDSSSRLCGDPPPDWDCWMWANALVLQTGPEEFAWYLHFAYDSIPDWIQEGVYVEAGTDIGQEGATGWASGPHIHFQVTSGFSCCQGSDDSRMPDWSFYDMYPVDFVEYTWEQLPWLAVSQNGDFLVEPPLPPSQEITPEPPTSTEGNTDCPNPYTVQPGEWLYKIAAVCHATVPDIVSANPGLNPDFILAGQQLNMPSGAGGHSNPIISDQPVAVPPAPPVVSLSLCSGTYVVAPGENLFRIAFNCGLTTDDMAMANGIPYPYTIYPGQVLNFP